MLEQEKKLAVKEVLLELFYVLSPSLIEVGIFELLMIWIKDPRQWFIAYLICMSISCLYILFVIRKHTYEDKANKLQIGLFLGGYYLVFIATATILGQLIFINNLGMNGRVLELILLAINLVIENLFHHILLTKIGKDPEL